MSKPLLMKNIAINPEDYTILAVDDIATNIMLLKAVLSRAKYKICLLYTSDAADE